MCKRARRNSVAFGCSGSSKFAKIACRDAGAGGSCRRAVAGCAEVRGYDVVVGEVELSLYAKFDADPASGLRVRGVFAIYKTNNF